MKIALCSSSVPFVNGGYRNIVDWLGTVLIEAGHQVETIYLPEVDSADLLFPQMIAYRWIDLEAADRIICFRPQSHLIPHRHKILWFIHHIRPFYDLWESPYRGCPDDEKHRRIRDALHRIDTSAFREAKRIYTNSSLVSRRLQQFNGTDSEVLYPPVYMPDRFYCREYGDEIVCICRVEHHKRQHLLVEAMRHVKTPVRLRLCGVGDGEYSLMLKRLIAEWGLHTKVTFENRWVSEQDKIEYLSRALAAAYLPVDEDSYGYPSVEASLSRKAVITTVDAGGVLELISDGVNGFVTETSPEAIAVGMDQLYSDRSAAQSLGRNAFYRLDELDISWSNVIGRLLS